MENSMKYIFGPINSRRLGISLGVDLVPYKTCSLDCIYCECGRTTQLTSKIDEYVSTNEVIKEIDEYLAEKPDLDVITFSGSGEPTLHRGIGEIIKYLKQNYPEYKVAVLTNGTLFWKKEVRNSVLEADLLIPSLDAISDSIFKKILRPAVGITSEKIISGLVELRKEFDGEIILEIFIVPGINDSDTELENMRQACLKIKPDKIQINSLDRPGTEDYVMPSEQKKLESIKKIFIPLNVEIIGKPAENKILDKHYEDVVDAITATLGRRPSTLDDLVLTLGLKKAEVLKVTGSMLERGLLIEEKQSRGIFFRVSRD